MAISHVYMPPPHTHTFVYRATIRVCIDFCIFDRTCVTDIFEKCYSYTAFFFSARQQWFFFGRNEVIYFSWYEGRNEFKVLRWIFRSCSSFLILIFTTTVHIFFAGLYIGCKCTIDIAPCIYHWMPCLTVEIGHNYGESYNPPGMYNSVYLKIF